MRILCTLILAANALTASWYMVEIPVAGLSSFIEGETGFTKLPAAITQMDITEVKPGEWFRAVAQDSDLKALDDAGISYRIVVHDMVKYNQSQILGPGPFGNYYTYSEALAIIDSLHNKYPNIVSEKKILPNDKSDTTWDGNYVYAVKISDNVNSDEDEPEVLFTGLHHAREPISVSIMVEGIRMFAEKYGKDPLITYLVNNREIWVIPMLNPDGYLYNEKKHPNGGGMQRKNRRQGSGDEDKQGVDINRNYPYKWALDDQGSSPDPDNQTYRGPSAGSEPETQSIIKLCKNHHFVTALNFHSYSRLFLYPWGYQADLACKDSSEFYGWGEIATRKNHYAVVISSQLYPTNGSSDDWMYNTGIFAVTPEVGTDFWQDYMVDKQVADNMPMLIATAKAAGKYPELEWIEWSTGANDTISAGEEIELTVKVRNMSVAEKSGSITLTLASSNPKVELVKGTAGIASLNPQTSGDNKADPLKVKLAASANDASYKLTLTVATASESYVYNITLPLGYRKLLINEGFETQPAAWTTDWAISSASAHSGQSSITDSPNAKYQGPKQYTLVSPVLDLSELSNPTLSFWHRFFIHKGQHSWWKGQDWGILQAKKGSGGDWQTLKRWNGTQSNWLKERFDLSAFANSKNVQIRFVLDVDSMFSEDGWYIDDVKLSAFSYSGGGVEELYELKGIYSNIRPLESVTTGLLNFAGPKGSEVKVQVFDESGRRVTETEGIIPFSWNMQDPNGGKLSTGVYFVKTVSPNSESTHKVVVLD